MAEQPVFITLISGLALCLILGANNLSACLGTSIGSRFLKYHEGLVLAAIGVFAGTVLEGSKLSGAITSRLVDSTSITFTLEVALSTFLVMAFLTYHKLPISLSQVIIGAAIGAAMTGGLRVNWYFAALVASSWIVTPLIGMALAIALSRMTMKLARRIGRILTLNKLYAYLTIFSGIYSAYALGANTVGLIAGMVSAPQSLHLDVVLMFASVTIIGMILFSRGTARSVSENIIGLSPSGAFAAQMAGAMTVHGFTEVGIPVSVSQAVVGGVLGAAIPRRIVVRNDRLVREIIIGWTVAPLLGAALAVLIGMLI